MANALVLRKPPSERRVVATRPDLPSAKPSQNGECLRLCENPKSTDGNLQVGKADPVPASSLKTIQPAMRGAPLEDDNELSG